MTKEVELIEVIRTTIRRRGRGVEDDPIRVVTEYWSKDGELLAEVDPCSMKHINLEKEREVFYSKLLPAACKECKAAARGKDAKKKRGQTV